MGIESFSLVPAVDQVTSLGATNLSKASCCSAQAKGAAWHSTKRTIETHDFIIMSFVGRQTLNHRVSPKHPRFRGYFGRGLWNKLSFQIIGVA
jgi:hypothetical protein